MYEFELCAFYSGGFLCARSVDRPHRLDFSEPTESSDLVCAESFMCFAKYLYTSPARHTRHARPPLEEGHSSFLEGPWRGWRGWRVGHELHHFGLPTGAPRRVSSKMIHLTNAALYLIGRSGLTALPAEVCGSSTSACFRAACGGSSCKRRACRAIRSSSSSRS